VSYTPPGIETDNGSLLFAFNDQTVSVPLTGEGVQSIPTFSGIGGSHQGMPNVDAKGGPSDGNGDDE
jgi:hypothetical protein